MTNQTKKWNLVIDVDKCENCNNCFLACKDEHVGNDFPGYAKAQPKHGHSWIEMYRIERGQTPMVESSFMPAMCNQCDDAPCIKAAGDGSIYKRPDGIVIIDPVKAVGRKDLVDSCPYGSIHWNEEEKIPQKWIFDAHLLDQGWKEPRCVQSCPTGAFSVFKVTDETMKQTVKDQELEEINAKHNTKPRVYYKNLFRFTKNFIGGSLETSVNGISEAVENAKITITSEGQLIGQSNSDNYGDFKIDHLDKSIKSLNIVIEHPNYKTLKKQVELSTSLYLGVLSLST